MIWFNIKQLEQNLKAGIVSEKEVFTYLLTGSLILTISPYLNDEVAPNKLVMWIELVFGVLFTIITLQVTFNINTKGDNQDYLKRYTCLSLVAIIRLFVFALPVVFVGLMATQILEYTNGIKIESLDYIIDVAMTVGLGIAYYFILTKSFKRVNQLVPDVA